MEPICESCEIHVKGKNKGKIILYAISTCPWCKKTKKLLSGLGVEYSYIDVDLVGKEEKKRIDEEVKKWNPQRNYPTIVIDDKKSIIGFKEDEIKEVLQQ
jgi:glutaredoxin-like protein NrdH